VHNSEVESDNTPAPNTSSENELLGIEREQYREFHEDRLKDALYHLMRFVVTANTSLIALAIWGLSTAREKSFEPLLWFAALSFSGLGIFQCCIVYFDKFLLHLNLKKKSEFVELQYLRQFEKQRDKVQAKACKSAFAVTLFSFLLCIFSTLVRQHEDLLQAVKYYAVFVVAVYIGLSQGAKSVEKFFTGKYSVMRNIPPKKTE
jgi:hypothetical protein